LAILSEHFQIGIDCVDVKTKHVFSYGRFPPHFAPFRFVLTGRFVGESFPMRCILIYSGIHYDAIAFSFIPSMPETDITLFQLEPPGEPTYAGVLQGAKEMAGKLEEAGYNVDTATFNIVCEQCGRGFIGEKEAIKHAEATGHTAFGQIPAEEDG